LIVSACSFPLDNSKPLGKVCVCVCVWGGLEGGWGECMSM
jgi:hypothetical protein